MIDWRDVRTQNQLHQWLETFHDMPQDQQERVLTEMRAVIAEYKERESQIDLFIPVDKQEQELVLPRRGILDPNVRRARRRRRSRA